MRETVAAAEFERAAERDYRRNDDRQRLDELGEVSFNIRTADFARVFPATEAGDELRGDLPDDDQWFVALTEILQKSLDLRAFSGSLLSTA